MKLNVLLAINEQGKARFKAMVKDYIHFFQKKQGSFRGEKRTYTPREGTIDEPTKRGVVRVATTVDEKILYFIQNNGPIIDNLLTQEKTNGSTHTIELKVGSHIFGHFNALELLRLKSIIESADFGQFNEMLSSIPTRSDAELWEKSTSPDYEGRFEIWETPLIKGVSKSTMKEHYVLEDPNLKHLKDFAGYNPPVAVKNITVELGDYTTQKFSGEISHQRRARILKRRTTLLTAIVKALKELNDVDTTPSEGNGEEFLNYIFS